MKRQQSTRALVPRVRGLTLSVPAVLQSPELDPPDVLEAAVKLPRLTISSLMALVLLVAVDVWACKELEVGGPPLMADLSDLIVFGALPMANVLAIGLYRILGPRPEHRRNRPALVGFEVGGLAALLVFLACSLSMTHSLHEGVGQVLKPIGLAPPGPVFLVCALILLVVPQVALALLGGWLCRRYVIRV
jgi:hypothetical protein